MPISSKISAIFSLFILSEDRRMEEGRSTIPEFQGHLQIDSLFTLSYHTTPNTIPTPIWSSELLITSTWYYCRTWCFSSSTITAAKAIFLFIYSTLLNQPPPLGCRSVGGVGFEPVLGIRIWIRRIRMFLGPPDPDPDPLVKRYGSGSRSFPFLIKVLSGLK